MPITISAPFYSTLPIINALTLMHREDFNRAARSSKPQVDSTNCDASKLPVCYSITPTANTQAPVPPFCHGNAAHSGLNSENLLLALVAVSMLARTTYQ